MDKQTHAESQYVCIHMCLSDVHSCGHHVCGLKVCFPLISLFMCMNSWTHTDVKSTTGCLTCPLFCFSMVTDSLFGTWLLRQWLSFSHPLWQGETTIGPSSGQCVGAEVVRVTARYCLQTVHVPSSSPPSWATHWRIISYAWKSYETEWPRTQVPWDLFTGPYPLIPDCFMREQWRPLSVFFFWACVIVIAASMLGWVLITYSICISTISVKFISFL